MARINRENKVGAMSEQIITLNFRSLLGHRTFFMFIKPWNFHSYTQWTYKITKAHFINQSSDFAHVMNEGDFLMN